jgi:hypothetical protein
MPFNATQAYNESIAEVEQGGQEKLGELAAGRVGTAARARSRRARMKKKQASSWSALLLRKRRRTRTLELAVGDESPSG